MSKKGRFFKTGSARKRTYRQEAGLIKLNVKSQISKVIGFLKKFKGLKYGTS